MKSLLTTRNISFFMPAYNCEKTVRESVESIFDGNFEDGDELVIVNDCSTDGTQEVLEELQEKFPNIRLFKHDRNKGGAAARNTAIENSKNDLLFCLDSDNVLVSGSISKLKNRMLNSNSDVAAFQELYYFTDSISNVTHKWIYKPGITTLADCLSGDIVPICSGNYMFTKESWVNAGGYPEFVGALDTWGFGFRQLATGAKLIILPETFYYHRHGYESYWIRDAKQGKTSLTAIQIIIPFLNLIKERDVDYIFSRRGRKIWFENLGKYPIQLRSGERGQVGVVEYLQPIINKEEKSLFKKTTIFLSKFLKPFKEYF